MAGPVLVNRLSQKFCALYARFFRIKVLLDLDKLYRAIHPTWVMPDGSISSGAFDGIEMSVDLASKTTVSRCWRRFRQPRGGLASVTVGFARALKQEVRHHPQPCNNAHTLVIGKKTRSVQRQLARNAQWEIHPKPHAAGASTQQGTAD